MKYIDTVTFIRQTEQRYDPDLGKEVASPPVEDKMLAHVSSPSIERSSLVFGDLKTTDLIIHLKQPKEGP